MSKGKAVLYQELIDVLDEDDTEQIVQYLSNYMNADELAKLVEYIKEEKGM